MTGRAYTRRMKRALDVGMVLCSIPITLPVMALTAALVLVVLGRPVLFRQTRPGLNGKPFELLKFRTMTRRPRHRREAARRHRPAGRAGAIPKEARAWTNSPNSSTFCVGEMSLVGPRPLLVEYLPRYSGQQRKRHEVSPGITGWAQVNGRNAVDWEKKFELDVWYVDHCSPSDSTLRSLANRGSVAQEARHQRQADETCHEVHGQDQRTDMPS